MPLTAPFYTLQRRAGQRAEIGEGMQYVAQRWSELVHPLTHVSRSVASHPDVITAVEDCRAALLQFRADAEMHTPKLLSAPYLSM